MKIAFGSDHAGADLKQELLRYAVSLGHEVFDLGADGTHSVDYPNYAFAVAEGVVNGLYDTGVLVCGSGLGVSIAANKVRGIRAALCHDSYTARMSREHNDANIVCLGQRVTGIGVATDILKTFLETPFSNGVNHIRRIQQVGDYERKNK